MFIDETGFLMAPLVRRTWARKGHTPILRQATRSHKKVSVVGALVVPARRIDVREGPRETVAIDHATLHPGIHTTHAGLPEDEGKWIYDPETGLVVLGCFGVDTKHRRPWHQY
ncbi:MAG TPA: hypothetical protein DD417_15645 [Elusimicrobia bacterium]|nr:hypothetical protein [Elusimicrobiota bacterium]